MKNNGNFRCIKSILNLEQQRNWSRAWLQMVNSSRATGVALGFEKVNYSAMTDGCLVWFQEVAKLVPRSRKTINVSIYMSFNSRIIKVAADQVSACKSKSNHIII